MRTASWVMSGLMAAVILTVAVFPVLDHHLAERVPGHAHLAPSGASSRWSGPAARHRHAYEVAHRHVGGQPVDAPATPASQRVVSLLAPHGSLATAWSSLSTSWLAPLPALPPSPTLTPMVLASPAEPAALAISPPERPPTVASASF